MHFVSGKSVTAIIHVCNAICHTVGEQWQWLLWYHISGSFEIYLVSPYGFLFICPEYFGFRTNPLFKTTLCVTSSNRLKMVTVISWSAVISGILYFVSCRNRRTITKWQYDFFVQKDILPHSSFCQIFINKLNIRLLKMLYNKCLATFCPNRPSGMRLWLSWCTTLATKSYFWW